MAEGSFADATLRVFPRRQGRWSARRLSCTACPGNWWCLTRCTRSNRTRRLILAVRWNCKAGKCGSCSAEVNGRPPAHLQKPAWMRSLSISPSPSFPMKAFPVIKDLVTGRLLEFQSQSQRSPPFQPRPGTDWKMDQRGRRSRTGISQVH